MRSCGRSSIRSACSWWCAATRTCNSIASVGQTRIVNAGSVGMPFQEAGAYWVLLGPGRELRRTDYDLESAAARSARRPRIRRPSSRANWNSEVRLMSSCRRCEQFKNAELT